MKNIKGLIASIAIVGLVGLVVGVSVKGATEDTVSATVTPKLITVTVTDGSVDYGTLGLDTTKNTALLNDPANLEGMTPVQTQTATDGSNVDVALNIKSSDAVGGTNWDLVAATGVQDKFVHKFKGGDATVWTQLPVDNVSYATLAASPAASSVDFDLQITTPTATTDHVQKIITVTVQVTE